MEQDRDVKEPVQHFNRVEEVALPKRVYVMEEITYKWLGPLTDVSG